MHISEADSKGTVFNFDGKSNIPIPRFHNKEAVPLFITITRYFHFPLENILGRIEAYGTSIYTSIESSVKQEAPSVHCLRCPTLQPPCPCYYLCQYKY